jgi:hypothetical protein
VQARGVGPNGSTPDQTRAKGSRATSETAGATANTIRHAVAMAASPVAVRSSPAVSTVEPLMLELADFCHAVVTGAQPRSSAALGVEVVRTIELVESVAAASQA